MVDPVLESFIAMYQGADGKPVLQPKGAKVSSTCKPNRKTLPKLMEEILPNERIRSKLSESAGRRQRGVLQAGEPLLYSIKHRGVRPAKRNGEDIVEKYGAKSARVLPSGY